MTLRQIAHYRLLEKLGAGGMGEVYLARDTRLYRKVALKVLPAELAASPTSLGRFEREVEAIAALNHPNVVTLYSVEKAGEVRFFTMEVVEGETLSRRIPPNGLPLDQFVSLALPLADGVAAVHEKGITHRDLKPANVMVSREGRLKVLDFGLAKFHRVLPAASDLTVEGRILGSGPYMSPEQVEGLPADPRSDVFTLGVVFYEMLTGRRPFEGRSEVGLMSSILRDPPRDLGRGELPRGLRHFLNRCLEKDPDRRFKDAGVVFENLVRIFGVAHYHPAHGLLSSWWRLRSNGPDAWKQRWVALMESASLLLTTAIRPPFMRPGP